MTRLESWKKRRFAGPDHWPGGSPGVGEDEDGGAWLLREMEGVLKNRENPSPEDGVTLVQKLTITVLVTPQ